MLDARAGQDTVIVAVNRLRTEACTVPDGLELEVGDMVVIRDEEAEDVGRVVDLSDAEEAQTEVLRRATEEEVALRQAVDREDGRALDVFNRLRQQHRLDMRVVGAHWRLDRRKVYLYFASESRTDFRALHRAITGALGARVAIRQVGVRDHVRPRAVLCPIHPRAQADCPAHGPAAEPVRGTGQDIRAVRQAALLSELRGRGVPAVDQGDASCW
jgi:cell fate regulator YaaT (PSP1 superfamily)